jgi:hypothetical protein
VSVGQAERRSLDVDVKVIVLALLYGCETWFLNLSEEHSAECAQRAALRLVLFG